MKNLSKHRPFVIFFILAYAISWAFWLPAVWLNLSIETPAGRLLETAGNFGPFFAAVILISIKQGFAGLHKLGARLLEWRVPGRVYLVALLGPFVLMAAAIAASIALGESSLIQINVGSLLLLIPAFLRILLVAGGLNEETGWRGVALPGLLAQTSAFRASLILGLLWGFWHAPLYFLPGTGQSEMVSSGTSFLTLFLAFIIWTVGLSILFTWLHEISRGSLLIAILFHAAINTAAGLPFLLGAQGSMAALLYPLFTWIVAIIVSRGSTFARSTRTIAHSRVAGPSG